MLYRLTCAAVLALGVAGCAPEQPYADAETVAQARYVSSEPPSVTLYTMVNNRTGKGGHSALHINASESIIFDPAGSYYADVVPERNDVLYGVSPAIEQSYRSAHARTTFHVVSQKLPLSAAQAEQAYQLAVTNGAVPGAFCANATSTILGQVLGKDAIKTTMYPTNLQTQFAQLPGVTTDKYYEGDSADLQDGLARGNAALTAQQE